MVTDGKKNQLNWHSLFRGRQSVDKKNMIVAWLDRESMDAEIDRYVEWDRTLTETQSWELVTFPRTPRSSEQEHFRKRFAKDGTYEIEDVLEYHYVWDDFRAALEQQTETRKAYVK